MAIRAALFDMDGTLIDIHGLWRGLLSCYLQPFGASLTEEQFQQAMTLSYDNLAIYLRETCGLPRAPREIMEEIDSLSLLEYAKRATLKENVAEYVRSLHGQGVQLAVVTTNLGEIAQLVLERFSLSPYFSGVYGVHELRHKKVFPECFLDIAGRLGVLPEECVVFEDSPQVAQSAKTAGMYVVGVLGEQTDDAKKDLITIADKIIENNYERLDVECQKSE